MRTMRNVLGRSWIAIPMLVAGCASGPAGSGDFCRIYEPVDFDPATPERVQRQIDKNELIYCIRCTNYCPEDIQVLDQ